MVTVQVLHSNKNSLLLLDYVIADINILTTPAVFYEKKIFNHINLSAFVAEIIKCYSLKFKKFKIKSDLLLVIHMQFIYEDFDVLFIFIDFFPQAF